MQSNGGSGERHSFFSFTHAGPAYVFAQRSRWRTRSSRPPSDELWTFSTMRAFSDGLNSSKNARKSRSQPFRREMSKQARNVNRRPSAQGKGFTCAP